MGEGAEIPRAQGVGSSQAASGSCMEEGERTIDLSVVVLGYDGARYLPRCLESIAVQSFDMGRCEVIYADNASRDESVEIVSRIHDRRLPHLRILRFEENLGYAKGNNRAAEACRGETLLFLNQDLVLDEGFLAEVLRSFERSPGAAVVGGTIRSAANGRMQSGGVRILVGGFAYNHLRSPGLCDAVSGAALAVRRAVFEELGGFEESYFMYYDETDLCVEARRAGYEVLYNPRAVAYDLTASYERRTGDPFFFYMLRNRPIFAIRHSLDARRTLLLDRLLYFPANVLMEVLRHPTLLRRHELIREARRESLRLCSELVLS